MHEEVLTMRFNVEKWVLRGFGFALVLAALASPAGADVLVTPEMDPGLATSALALVGGGLAIMAGRVRRK
jgi:hypothetical protein